MPRNQEIAKWLEVSGIFFLWQLDHQKLRKHNPDFGDPADCEGKACQIGRDVWAVSKLIGSPQNMGE